MPRRKATNPPLNILPANRSPLDLLAARPAVPPGGMINAAAPLGGPGPMPPPVPLPTPAPVFRGKAVTPSRRRRR
jgi:hypothetical protein